MRISDWSSDVCSSDLELDDHGAVLRGDPGQSGKGDGRRLMSAAAINRRKAKLELRQARASDAPGIAALVDRVYGADRKSVVSGKSGSVRVDLGGRRIHKKKKEHRPPTTNNQQK